MTQTTETRPTHNDSANICFDQVSKWFRRKGQIVHALSKVSLDIADGEFVSFIGPSGCGKSTLLRLGGTIDIKGETPNTARRLKHYSFIPQHPALLPWRTVRRNVSMLCEVNRRASTAGISAEAQLALLDQLGLGSFIDSYPKELSGGMQQRVSIARAFALDAPVMLMDEPFSALDEITRSEIRYLLLDLWSQARSTVLFVTHSIPEAVVMSDRVIVLGARPGRVTDIIDVDLPRPRHEAVENSDRYHYLVNEVRVALRKGSS